MTSTLTLEVGAMTMNTDLDEAKILEIKGRWVKLDNGRSISRSDALAGMQIWLDENPAEEEEPEEEEGSKMAETIRKYREDYIKTVSYSGNNSLDNGDEVAEVLRGMSPNETCALADKVFQQEPMHHWERWQHLNAGSRRMNAGNRIRGAVKRGEVTAQELRDYADHKDIKLDEAEV